MHMHLNDVVIFNNKHTVPNRIQVFTQLIIIRLGSVLDDKFCTVAKGNILGPHV